MPRAENDPNCNMKKKLIANNFVSIVFNESGAPFKLGSVCGQFAHVALEVSFMLPFHCPLPSQSLCYFDPLNYR